MFTEGVFIINSLKRKVMRTIILIVLIFASTFSIAEVDEGFIAVKTKASVNDAANSIVEALEGRGMTVFSKIDHAHGAREAGLELRPTMLIIFGNPKVGTGLMQCDQKMGIELPMKLLVWQDEGGETNIGYYDPTAFADYYMLETCKEILRNMKKALANFAKAGVR